MEKLKTHSCSDTPSNNPQNNSTKEEPSIQIYGPTGVILIQTATCRTGSLRPYIVRAWIKMLRVGISFYDGPELAKHVQGSVVDIQCGRGWGRWNEEKSFLKYP